MQRLIPAQCWPMRAATQQRNSSLSRRALKRMIAAGLIQEDIYICRNLLPASSCLVLRFVAPLASSSFDLLFPPDCCLIGEQTYVVPFLIAAVSFLQHLLCFSHFFSDHCLSLLCLLLLFWLSSLSCALESVNPTSLGIQTRPLCTSSTANCAIWSSPPAMPIKQPQSTSEWPQVLSIVSRFSCWSVLHASTLLSLCPAIFLVSFPWTSSLNFFLLSSPRFPFWLLPRFLSLSHHVLSTCLLFLSPFVLVVFPFLLSPILLCRCFCCAYLDHRYDERLAVYAHVPLYRQHLHCLHHRITVRVCLHRDRAGRCLHAFHGLMQYRTEERREQDRLVNRKANTEKDHACCLLLLVEYFVCFSLSIYLLMLFFVFLCIFQLTFSFLYNCDRMSDLSRSPDLTNLNLQGFYCMINRQEQNRPSDEPATLQFIKIIAALYAGMHVAFPTDSSSPQPTGIDHLVTQRKSSRKQNCGHKVTYSACISCLRCCIVVVDDLLTVWLVGFVSL